MHELSVTREIVDVCARRAGGLPVRSVTVAIGRLSAVMPDAVKFCFDVCARGTSLEGAELHVLEVPGHARCRDCGREFALDRPDATCECGSTRLEWLGGQELTVKEMEVDDVR